MSEPPTEKRKPRGRPEMPSAQRESMKRRISEIAGRLFREDGYSKVSMRRIAGELGCTPMTLYGYYNGKIDILRSLWGDVFESVFDALARCRKDKGAQAYLLELCNSYVQYWLEHPECYRLVFMAEGVMQDDVSLFLDNPEIIARYGVFADAIADLESEPPDADIKPRLDFLLSTLHGIAHNSITISGYPWSPPEAQIRYALAGIATKNK